MNELKLGAMDVPAVFRLAGGGNMKNQKTFSVFRKKVVVNLAVLL